MVKVGIIRCQQTENMCPGTACFKFAALGKGSFESVGAVEVMGFISCGGCPGKNAVPRAEMLIKKGAEKIVLASCITKGTPIGFACPFREEMKAAIQRRIGDIEIIEGTH